MAGRGSGLSLDNPVFRAFITYAVIVVLKTMAMSLLTSFFRFKNKAFANPEDTGVYRDKDGGRLKPVLTDQGVERVRRCHLNDLENVLPFVLIGLLYVTTSPDPATATLCFRLFTGSRLCHLVAYLLALPQPARGLSFCVGYCSTIYMAYSSAKAVGFAL